MVDVHTIGAGGGSIAWVNEAGLLQVGPESAGASPGPICYGRGGRLPTITDANLVLGRLDPEGLLAVDNPVTAADVEAILEREIGRRLGLDAQGAAAAILRIANNRMAGALRMVSLARGHDPRDFALFAFGGAGPLHATALAREIGIPRVLIPARPGITNAIGCVVADLRHDYVNTLNRPVADLDMARVRAILEEQIEEGRATIDREGVAVDEIAVIHSADMQFQGQTHILTVAVPGVDVARARLQEAFEEAYWRRFEVELPEIRAVLVNLNTAVIGRRRPVPLAAFAHAPAPTANGGPPRREVWFEASGVVETPIHRRENLAPGDRLAGPAIVEQLDTTVVVEPGDVAVTDDFGNLVISVAGRGP